MIHPCRRAVRSGDCSGNSIRTNSNSALPTRLGPAITSARWLVAPRQQWGSISLNAPMRYANSTGRLRAAIGEAQMIDTAKDPRPSRIFLNRTIRTYPAFSGFYGMENTIELIVAFFRHAAQGLEERKQMLYLLGP